MSEPTSTDSTPTTLNAYIVGIWYDGESQWDEPRFVAAESPERAVRFAFPGFDDRRVALILEGEDNCYSVKPAPEFDPLVAGPGKIRVTIDDERNAGWAFEGESPCEVCGLYACDLEKYRVCPFCDQCAECGHTDDCPEVLIR